MRRLGQWLVVLALVVVVGAVTFYERPLWVVQQRTHLGLFFSHVQSNYVMTPEGRVHYYDAEASIPGGGTPLVLVHGLADRDESWAPMLTRLRRAGFHVYAPDLLGYGRSPKPDNSDYSISTEEQFVADFIQSLGLQKTEIAGHSMGGWIALKLALDHPEMIDRIAVYDSAGIKMADNTSHAALFDPQTPDDINRLLATMEPRAKPLPAFVARDAVRRFQSNEAVVRKSEAAMMTGNDLLDSQLPKLTQPLLIVWGSADQLTPLSTGQAMHALVPSSELDIVEGCGHLAPQHCSSAVAGATADFFRSNPAPQGGTRTIAPR